MLLDRKKTCVVIFNMQLEMIPLLENSVLLLNNCIWLADLSTELNLPLIILEHKKLGQLSQLLVNVSPNAKIIQKDFFDCTLQENIKKQLLDIEAEQFVFAGAETHVCLFQSALGLRSLGKKVYLLGDSTSTRNVVDYNLALQRFNRLNFDVISQEMFFFEMIRNSEVAEYHGLAMKFLDGRYIS
jgi:hypothetical protein